MKAVNRAAGKAALLACDAGEKQFTGGAGRGTAKRAKRLARRAARRAEKAEAAWESSEAAWEAAQVGRFRAPYYPDY
jgi:hypothetical protein